MRLFLQFLLLFIASSCRAQSDTLIFPGREFVYEYSIVRAGDTCLFVFQEPMADDGTSNANFAWDFCPIAKDKTCAGVLIERVGLKFMKKISPDSMLYTNYLCYSEGNEMVSQSISASVVNSDQVWLHPPRTKGFRILECSPFPHIRFDSTQWSWKLEVGSQWGDVRWKQWKGDVEFNFEYQITGEQTLPFQNQAFKCIVVEAKSSSWLGASGLTSWFSPVVGFLKMEFRNIDGSVLTMRLVEIR